MAQQPIGLSWFLFVYLHNEQQFSNPVVPKANQILTLTWIGYDMRFARVGFPGGIKVAPRRSTIILVFYI